MVNPDLQSIWSAHEHAPFPEGHAGMKFGCNLMGVDSLIRAAVIAYLECGRPPMLYRRTSVEGAVAELKSALPNISAPAKSYFDRSLALGEALLGR